MAERSKSLTRRDFNKLFAAGIVAAASLPLYESVKSYVSEADLSFLERISGVESLPVDLYGVHFNAPYLWKRTGSQIDEFVSYTRETTPKSDVRKHTVRILPEAPDFLIEKELGNISNGQLKILSEFIDYLPEDFQVILPIIDGYWLFRSNVANPMYPPSALDSPYIKDTSTAVSILRAQEGFFTGTSQKEAYKYRADAFIHHFGDNDRVLLEMGNEVSIPSKVEDPLTKNSLWYAEMYSHIRKRYGKPLLTGVANPGSIDYGFFPDKEGLITTDHVYWPRLLPYSMDVPVIIEEIGVSSEMFGREFSAADSALMHLIASGLENGVNNGLAKVGSVFVWHADHWHDDNLQFNEENYPEATKLIHDLSLKLGSLRAI